MKNVIAKLIAWGIVSLAIFLMLSAGLQGGSSPSDSNGHGSDSDPGPY